MAFGQMSLGSVVALMGGNIYNSPQAIFEEVASVAGTLAGSSMVALNRSGGKSGLTSATVGQVSAYTNSDFNAYTSYVNSCYAEVDEPIAELSGLAAEAFGPIRKMVAGGAQETEPSQVRSTLIQLQGSLLSLYFPETTEEQIEALTQFYKSTGKGASQEGMEAAPTTPQVSASAANGFTVTDFGKKVAEAAEKAAVIPAGKALSVVAQALAANEVRIAAPQAFEAADKLAESDKYVECTDAKSEQLKELPPGAVVVWAQDDTHPNGFISIALGGGREAAEIVRKQQESHSASFRLFLPL